MYKRQLVNHATQTHFAADVAAATFGEDKVQREAHPMSGSEDFSFFLEAVPGSYLFLGNGDGTHRATDRGPGPCELHNPSYDFNDALLPIGATYWVRLTEAFFKREA